MMIPPYYICVFPVTLLFYREGIFFSLEKRRTLKNRAKRLTASGSQSYLCSGPQPYLCCEHTVLDIGVKKPLIFFNRSADV